jgi:hypothetical protein
VKLLYFLNYEVVILLNQPTAEISRNTAEIIQLQKQATHRGRFSAELKDDAVAPERDLSELLRCERRSAEPCEEMLLI